jgi:hypothetical protein
MNGFTEEHTRQLVGNSSSPRAGNTETRGICSDSFGCPNLRKGRTRNLCTAYIGRVTVPSVFEEENYCSSHLYGACAWFRASAREVIEEHRVAGSDSPENGVRPMRLLAAAETQ